MNFNLVYPESKVTRFYKVILLMILLFAAGIPQSNLSAQKPQLPTGLEIDAPNNDTYFISGSMRVNARTGFPVAMYSLDFPVTGPDPESKARQFLSANSETIGLLNNDLSDLSLKNISTGNGSTIVRFNQKLNGIPVLDGEITITINNNNRVVFLMSGYQPDLNDIPTTTLIAASDARNIARNYLQLSGTLDVDRNELIIFHLNGETKLCYKVILMADEPLGEWESLVDAMNGELIRVKDNAFYCEEKNHDKGVGENCPLVDFHPPMLPPVNGTGNVFDADPLSSAGVAYGGAYVDGNDANNASLTAQTFNRTLLDIDLTGGTYTLRGPYAWIYEFENPNYGIFSQASANFNFNRFDNAFEAANTYYHTDKSMRYLNLTIGVTVMPYQYANGVRFDAHGLNGADNSHYITSNGRMAFGEGGVDDAEDVDVILHELGHGLHDWITNGGLSNIQGLSEGSGDYWCQSYSRSLNQWTVGQAAYHWTFSWDGHNPFWGGRTTNYGAVYPGGLTGAIHTDGQIWATCMMDIYDAIGKTTADKALWEGLRLTNGTANQNDAAIAVRQAAINMGYSPSDISTISTLLTSCGYSLPPLPLPLELTDFNLIRLNDHQVYLDWKVENSCNTDKYFVERQLPAEKEWKQMGFVKGLTFCGPAEFQFNDENRSMGITRYRIQELDKNGNRSYSEIREIGNFSDGKLEVVIFPQPVESDIRIWINTFEQNANPFHIRIMNSEGKVIKDFFAPSEGLSTEVIFPEAGEWTPGIYFAEVIGSGERVVRKFSIVR